MYSSVFRRNYTYIPLPSSHTTAPRKRPGLRWVAASFILLSAFAGATWTVHRVLKFSQNSPQRNYQSLYDLLYFIFRLQLIYIRNSPPLVHTGERSSPVEKRAVVSSLYSDSFAAGVAVLGHSVRRANTTSRLILPYLEDHVSATALCIAQAVGWETVPVPFIHPPHNGKGINHRFVDQYTKLNIWSLDKVGIEQAVYLDADTLVRRNIDELFDLPFNFAAVPDVYDDKRGFTVNFNAGVLVLRPSTAVLNVMKEKMETADFPLEQAEQSFLNLFFSASALRLPYQYNANLAIKQSSPVMWEGMKEEIRVVHYTLVKPFWEKSLDSSKLLTEEGLRMVMNHAAKKNNGVFAEEVMWWRDAYDQMMEDHRGDIKHCHSIFPV
jgi:hypothetical protein